MKIYYGERLIRLTNYFPLTTPSGTMVLYYDQEDKLSNRFIEFGESKDYAALFLWSGGRFKELKKIFCSFFRIIEAAGGVVKNEKDEILVIFRNGKWDLPKGKIEKDRESTTEAAVREVKEETGLRKVSIGKKLMTTHHLYFRKDRMVLKPTQWFEMFADSSSRFKPDKKENITLVKWVNKKEMGEILSNTYASLKDLFILVQ